MTAPAVTSIVNETGSIADVQQIWASIPATTWMAMGADPRSRLAHPDALQVDIHLGLGTRRARLIIKLNVRDLYDVELGRNVRRRTEYGGTFPEYTVMEQLRDVHVADLNRAIQNLYDRHTR